MNDAEWIRTYEHDFDYIESLGAVNWADAPLPSRWHHCQAQTRGWFGFNYVERCACGATRLSSRDPWMHKNETRQGQAQKRREKFALKVQVICGECGEPYEAIIRSRIARARLCNSCWADRLVRDYAS